MSTITSKLRKLVGASRETGPVQATWNGAVVAESDQTVEVEGNRYFPRDDVRNEYLQPSSHTTTCPWKGTASYCDVVVAGERNEAAAWYYPRPNPAAKKIKDHVAFWHGVRVKPAHQR